MKQKKITSNVAGKIVMGVCASLFFLSLSVPIELFADEQSYYNLARSCAEYVLRQEEYFAFFDKLMAETVMQLAAENPQLHGHEEIVTEIYQEGTREFIIKIKALENTWDKAARKLMADFSESELSAVTDYQHGKIGEEFLKTETGRKWEEKAEAVILSAIEDVRHGFGDGANYDLYRKSLQDKFDLYESQGKEIPDFLVRPKDSRSFKPTEEGTALFEVFETIPKNDDQSKLTIKAEHPLLVVFSLRDCILDNDDKGVMLRLNEEDTRVFAELTRKFQGRILLLKATDKIMEGMRIVEPNENGCIDFKYPQSADMAEYFRKRYHLAEFK